jgi:Mn-dependent DtxR family transcriptional regulator
MEKQKIGAWKKATSKGEVIEFTINEQRYSMWANPYKKEEKQPDFNIIPNDYKPKAEFKKEYSTPINQQENEDQNLPF